MRIAIVAAEFPPGEADRLRRAMATFKRVGTIKSFQQKFVDGMTRRGYELDFAEHCFEQIEGFGEYGFPESHAASFANLVYASAWMKCHYPDVFAAALLNSQPMGFYAPSQIVRDAQEHGVEVRTSISTPRTGIALLEPGAKAAERLHPRHAAHARRHVASTHAVAAWASPDQRLFRRAWARPSRRRAARASIPSAICGCAPDCSRRSWNGSPHADAFRSLGLDRRDALWAIRALQRSGDKDDLPLVRARQHAGAGARCALAVDAAGRAGRRGLPASAPVA